MLALFGVCASALIYYGAIKPSYPRADESQIGEPINLTDVLDNKFFARHNNATWISDSELFYKDAYVSVDTFFLFLLSFYVLALSVLSFLTIDLFICAFFIWFYFTFRKML